MRFALFNRLSVRLSLWYTALFAVGNYLYGRMPQAWLLTVVFVVSTAGLTMVMRRLRSV